jgi:hypothetical protein
MLPRRFLDRYEDELGYIVLQTQREIDMPQWRRWPLNSDPMLNKALETSKELNQHLSKSIQMLRAQEALEEPTPLPAVSFIDKPKEKLKMGSVLGLNGNLIESAIERAKQRLVAKTTEGVTRIETVTTAGEAKIDGVVTNLAVKIEKEIEDQVSQFVGITNGGPA